MRIVRVLLLTIVAATTSLTGVQGVSYAEETNQSEAWSKAYNELQRKIKDNDQYLKFCEDKLAEKKLTLEEARRKGQSTVELEAEIGRLQRERVIRFESGKRWKVEINSLNNQK